MHEDRAQPQTPVLDRFGARSFFDKSIDDTAGRFWPRSIHHPSVIRGAKSHVLDVNQRPTRRIRKARKRCGVEGPFVNNARIKTARRKVIRRVRERRRNHHILRRRNQITQQR